MYIAGYVALSVLDKDIPDLKQIEVKTVDLSPFLGDYHATNSFYYGPGDVSIVKYEDDPNIYRKRSDSDSKGQKLYYLGNNEFGYEPYPMDRISFSSRWTTEM